MIPARFIRTLTRESGEPPTGRIPDILPEMFPDSSAYSVFIAGSPGFVDARADAARELGAKEHLLHTEDYHVQQDPHAPPAERLLG